MTGHRQGFLFNSYETDIELLKRGVYMSLAALKRIDKTRRSRKPRVHGSGWCVGENFDALREILPPIPGVPPWEDA